MGLVARRPLKDFAKRAGRSFDRGTLKLKRTLGAWAVVAFGVTNQIGAGLFFVTTQIQQTFPGVGDLVPWLMIVGGAITALTVVAYRYFFASGLVGAGGEYLIIARAVGPRSAFLATFLAWFGMTGALGTLAYVAPKFLANACTALGLGDVARFLASPQGTLLAGLALLWGAWWIHVRSVRLAGRLAVAAMFFAIAVAVTLIVYGFATTPPQFAAALQAHVHVSIQAAMAAAPVSQVNIAAAVGSALPVLFFAYLGLSTATQTGAETIDPRRAVGKGVLVAVSLVTVIYSLFAFAIYHAVPWQAMAGLAALKLSTYTTATGLLGLVMPGWLASAMNAFVALIVVKTFLPLLLAQSRWIYAWSQDGLIPGFFAATHARHRTPVLALTISAILGSASLAESLASGYAFGVNLRVLSAMGVFFLMGIGMLLFPSRAPALYRANASRMAARRSFQIGTGIALMAFSAWFAFSIVYASRGQPLWLQPIVQALLVGLIAALIYRAAPRSVR